MHFPDAHRRSLPHVALSGATGAMAPRAASVASSLILADAAPSKFTLPSSPYFALTKDAAGTTARLTIDGFIGGYIDYWTGEENGKSSASLKKELKSLGAVQTLEIDCNSPGGILLEGIEMNIALAALVESGVTVNFNVGAVCASAATMPAMAATTIRITDLSLFMIHEVSTDWAYGSIEDLEKTIGVMKKMNTTLTTAYSNRNTKLDAAAISAMVAAETWFTGAEAVENGFADELVSVSKITACAGIAQLDMSKAPDHIKALAARILNDATADSAEVAKLKADLATALAAVETATAASTELTAQVEVLTATVTALTTKDEVKEPVKDEVKILDVAVPAVAAVKTLAIVNKWEIKAFDAAIASGASLDQIRARFLAPNPDAPKLPKGGLADIENHATQPVGALDPDAVYREMNK